MVDFTVKSIGPAKEAAPKTGTKKPHILMDAQDLYTNRWILIR